MTQLHHGKRTSEYVTEWPVGAALMRVCWQPPCLIHAVSITRQRDETTESSPPQDDKVLAMVFWQALVIAGHRLSLDDGLQAMVAQARLELERTLLSAVAWHDQRPCDDTAVARLPLTT
ncbi:hypothetical protein DFR26_0123 [Paraperlucidibaca baekdonensis]|uniref:Uncharacterized protein n=1 Tax=Paraperlucidibaca baekdonensis TaxID=748120 RepID=A0A3E0H862_9GAMM|nr:hypothetical protein [Paraperlucidibaca baekdonensis]REH39928.1 hypothetical protein DFR26_0123 [Paraperlucidibaca baekdonensis]